MINLTPVYNLRESLTRTNQHHSSFAELWKKDLKPNRSEGSDLANGVPHTIPRTVMAAGAVERVHTHKHLGHTEAVFLTVASLKMSPRNMWAVKVQSPQFLSWVRLLLPYPQSPPLPHPLSRCLSVYEVYMGRHIETTAPHVPLCHSLPSEATKPQWLFCVPSPLTPRAGVIGMHTVMSGFYVHAGDLISGLYSCTTKVLTLWAISPSPYFLMNCFNS